MNGKGDKPRPIDVERKVFEDNWDRIFKRKNKPDMWDHNCKHDGAISIAKGEACNWCGMKEDGSLD